MKIGIKGIGVQGIITIFLILLGVASLVLASAPVQILILMLLAYASNASYSMVSRSAVRTSALYHAFTVFLNNALFYSVLHRLVGNELSLALFIPYTVATVFGSQNGSMASMRIESLFGIKANPDKKAKPTLQSVLAQKVLLGFVGVLGIVAAIFTRDLKTAAFVAFLALADNLTFSILRRSRNTNNVAYHVIASLIKGTIWYLLFRELSLSKMALAFFPQYCFGSVLGGLIGQDVSLRIERLIGASADDHLKSSAKHFMPVVPLAILSVVVVAISLFAHDPRFALYLALLSGAQQISFTLVSRSRNRGHMGYHMVASILSNGVWFLTFRQANLEQWSPDLYLPFTLGGTAGSISGAGISMQIERKLGISSDAHVAPKPS